MSPLYQTYLSLVRAALWNEQVTWPDEYTEDLLRLNAMQGTGALVYPFVLEQPTLSSYARAHMKSVCVSAMQKIIPLQHTLELAWTALEKAGIRPVLMKGAGLAALYPEPHFRTFGDIDLFVGIDQYHPACAVMRETFPNALKFDEELDHYKHYNLIADGISIEVHRVSVGLQHPIDERRYARMEQYGMTHAIPITNDQSAISNQQLAITFLIPEPTFNALFVFLHSWEHMMTQGANVRQLCDLALLLHRYAEQIDAARLKHYLTSLHLLDVWQLYMYHLVCWLGLPRTEALFYTERVANRAERLMNDLLAGKMVEQTPTEKAPTNRIARKWHTMRSRFANARRIKTYSPAYARHMNSTTLLNGARRFFAKDRHWE